MNNCQDYKKKYEENERKRERESIKKYNWITSLLYCGSFYMIYSIFWPIITDEGACWDSFDESILNMELVMGEKKYFVMYN